MFLIGLVPCVFVLALFFAPMRYSITTAEVIVERLGPNVVILIQSIDEIRRIQKKELGFTLRLFGVGGFCGAYGTFWNRRLGAFQAYITNTKTLILIKHQGGRKILLSPEKPEEFVDAVARARNLLSPGADTIHKA